MINFQCNLQAPLNVFVKSLSSLALFNTFSHGIAGGMSLNCLHSIEFSPLLRFFFMAFPGKRGQLKAFAHSLYLYALSPCMFLHVQERLSHVPYIRRLVLGYHFVRSRATQGFSAIFILTSPLFSVGSSIP